MHKLRSLPIRGFPTGKVDVIRFHAESRGTVGTFESFEFLTRRVVSDKDWPSGAYKLNQQGDIDVYYAA